MVMDTESFKPAYLLSLYLLLFPTGGPVRFAKKTSWNIVLTDLLWGKNTIPTEKIIRQANGAYAVGWLLDC